VKKIANLAYHCGLIVEGVYYHGDDMYREIGAVNVAHVERLLGAMLIHIQEAAASNGAGNLAHQLHLHFDPLKHALTFLAAFLADKATSDDDRLTAIIFANYVYTEAPKLVRDYGYEATSTTQ
jgi:hypothetical protein